MLSFLGITENDIRDIRTTSSHPSVVAGTSSLVEDAVVPKLVRSNARHYRENQTEDDDEDDDEMLGDDLIEEGVADDGETETDEELVKHLQSIADTPPVLSTMTVCGNFGGSINLVLFMERAEIMPYWCLKPGVIRVECYNEKREWIFKGISRKYLIRKNPGTGPFPNGVTVFARIFDEETGDAREPSIKVFRNGGFQITGIRTPTQSDAVVLFMREYLRGLGGDVFQETPTPSWFTSVSMMNTDVSIGRVIHRKLVQEILHKQNLKSTYESTSYQGVNIKYYWNPGRHQRGEEQTGDCPCEKQCSSSGKKRVLVRPTDGPVTSCTRITIAPFQKGKIVITAAKNEKQLHDAVRWILGFLIQHRHQVVGKRIQEKIPKTIANPFKRSQRNTITVPKESLVQSDIELSLPLSSAPASASTLASTLALGLEPEPEPVSESNDEESKEDSKEDC
jgi:TATA-box binding protein (TBP) (component of TFIID and TFIIIB)